MRDDLARRILSVADKLAESKISFDEVMEDVRTNVDSLDSAMQDAEDVVDLLTRSGYPEQADRVREVMRTMESAHKVVETIQEMYRRGKLRYGPRLPKTLWHSSRGIHT